MPLGLLLSLLLLLGGAQAAVVTVCETGCAATTLAAALSASIAGDEIVLVGGSLHNESSVNITFPLTIRAQSPVDIVTAEADTGLAWLNVSSTLTLAGNLTIHSAALYIGAGGEVRQQGALSITPLMGLESLPSKEQRAPGPNVLRVTAAGGVQGALVVNAPNNQTIGVFCEGEWLQEGSFQVNSSSPPVPCLPDSRGCLECGIGAWVVFGGRWTQNGTVQIKCPHIAVAVLTAEWIQNAPAQLSVIANEPPTPLTAAVMVVGGVWKQSAALDVVASLRSAPGYGFKNLWQQDASVKLHVTSPLSSADRPYVGLEFDGTNSFWNQNADVAISLGTPSTTSAFNCNDHPLWNAQKGNLSVSPPEEFSLGECVRTVPFSSSISASEQPVLRFDTTDSALKVVPKAKSEQNPDQFVVVDEATVGLGLASINEVADNGTRLQTGQVLFAGWSVMANNSVGASQAFVLRSLVVVDDGTSQANAERQCMVEMEVFLFDEATNVSIGDLASFTVLPALTKFAIRVSSWPWLSATGNSSRLEVRLAVSPSFTNVTYPSPTPPPLDGPVATKRQEAPGLTRLILNGQRSSDGKRALTTEVRFVSVVELDGVLQGPSGVGRAPVEFDADVESSSLVLSFGHFAANMSYDPDLGVLVGRRDKDGSSSSGTSDDKAWIIAVSIAVPLAVVFVVAVIVVGVVVLTVRKRNRTKQLQKRLKAARQETL